MYKKVCSYPKKILGPSLTLCDAVVEPILQLLLQLPQEWHVECEAMNVVGALADWLQTHPASVRFWFF